jgi:tetratricopeptide (TPR) repeat protein
MKKIIIAIQLLLIFFVCIGLCYGETSQERFAQANQLYEEVKYPEALQIYLEIEKSTSHWKLFYNIGNCYYKLNQYVNAKIYFLKAQRFKPFDQSIQKNIEIVNKKFSDKIPGEKQDFVTRVVKKIETLLSLNVFTVLLLISIFLFNLFLFGLFKKGKNKIILYGVSFSLVITLLILGYHIIRVEKVNRQNTAVIITHNSKLRSGPGDSNTVLFKVNPGLKVKIIDQSRGWYQVSASSQIAGWVKSDSIVKI